MKCLHENATIALYEAVKTNYCLMDGAVWSAKELEGQPLAKGEIHCSACGFEAVYDDWEEAPEPIVSYFRQAYLRDYK